MKIKTTLTQTVIEATAEELRQSNTTSEAFLQVLRRAFNGAVPEDEYEEIEEMEE